jgi:hypothetical protein
MLRVLHAVDEVTTDQFGHEGKRVVRTEHVPAGLLLAQDFLVTLCTSYMFTVVLTYKVCKNTKTTILR